MMLCTGAILHHPIASHFTLFVREGSGSSFVEVDDFVQTEGFGSRRVWPQLCSNHLKSMHVLVYKLTGPAECGTAVPPVRVSLPATASGTTATAGGSSAMGSTAMGSAAAEVEHASIDHGAEMSVDPRDDGSSTNEDHPHQYPFFSANAQEAAEQVMVVRHLFPEPISDRTPDLRKWGQYLTPEELSYLACQHNVAEGGIAFAELQPEWHDGTEAIWKGSKLWTIDGKALDDPNFEHCEVYVIVFGSHFMVMSRNLTLVPPRPWYQWIERKEDEEVPTPLQFCRALYLSDPNVELGMPQETSQVLQKLLNNFWGTFEFFGVAADGNCGLWALSLAVEMCRRSAMDTAASMDAPLSGASESMESAEPIEAAESAAEFVPPPALPAGLMPKQVVCGDCLIREITDKGTPVSVINVGQLRECFELHQTLGTVPYRIGAHTRQFCPQQNQFEGEDWKYAQKLKRNFAQWLRREIVTRN